LDERTPAKFNAATMPAKAIPPARDRVQSRLLVWTVAPLILVACAQTIYLAHAYRWEMPLAKAIAVSVVFSLAAWLLRAATPAAAAIGGTICLMLTFWTGSIAESALKSALTPLLALFVLTFLATRSGRGQKAEHGLAESRRGRRTSQVIANLGVAALLSNFAGDRAILWFAQNPGIPDLNSLWILRVVVLATLAEATADTVASEIGQAFGGTPILLTTLRRVEPGTDGAFTFTGTIAGIIAAAVVAGIGAWSMHLDTYVFSIAMGAATLGLFFDSLLGATLELRGWIGNDLVNFASTAFAAFVALLALRFGRGH
jgi:uncharacterized protein (TIGR00297 family)